MLQAAEKGNIERLRNYLSPGANVNDADKEGRTALYLASSNGHLECVEMLIKAKAKVDAYDSCRMTPLMCASKSGFLPIVDALIDAKADPNRFSYTMSPLGYACTRLDSASLVERLLRAGADPNREDHTGITFHVNKDGADIKVHDFATERTPLVAAIMGRNVEAATLLVDAKANVHQQTSLGDPILALAAMTGSVGMVKLLLAAGADVHFKDKTESTVLHLISGHTSSIIEHVARQGKYAFNARGFATPSVKDRKDIVAALVAAKADVEARNDESRTPLFWASNIGTADDIRALLASGADPNALDGQDYCCLGTAIDRNDIDKVRVLIDAKADVNYIPDGLSMLDIATRHSTPEIAKAIKDAGGMPNNEILYAKSPLYSAVNSFRTVSDQEFASLFHADTFQKAKEAVLGVVIMQRRRDRVLFMLRHGVSPSSKCNGRYHLHRAVRDGQPDMVTLLIAAKADVEQKDIYNMTALQWAAKAKDRGVVAMLLKRANDVKKEKASA
jgi:ankyrin repeat protein